MKGCEVNVTYPVMYPLELREQTNLSDSLYPVNLFHNVSPQGEIGRTVLYMHWHEHMEFIYITAGKASFHIDRRQFDAEPGDFLVVPSGGLHVGYASSAETVEFWSLVFSRTLVDSPFHDPIHDHYLSPYLSGSTAYPVKLEEQSVLRRIRLIFNGIIDEYKSKEPAYELIVKSQVLLILSLLSRHSAANRTDGPAPQPNKRIDRIKEALLYIRQHYDKKLTLTEAARMVNLTPYYFCNVFKAATGRTFVDYVNRYRMDIAERLLKEGATVTEAAAKVGYDNLNYFTKTFKRIKGVTPSEMKKRGAGGAR